LILVVVYQLDVEDESARVLVRPHEVDVVRSGVQPVRQRAVQQVAQHRHVPLAAADLSEQAALGVQPWISKAAQKERLAESTRRSPSISRSGRCEVFMRARARLTVDFICAADDSEIIAAS
jgi:hypothetical protein